MQHCMLASILDHVRMQMHLRSAQYEHKYTYTLYPKV